MTEIPYKIYLSEKELPTTWYNLKAVMKEKPAAMLHPGTLQPCTADDLKQIFCEDLVKQELNTTDRFIEIPKEYGISTECTVLLPWSAYCLERYWILPKIYYKFEGTNTSVPQIKLRRSPSILCQKQGITHLTTETGADNGVRHCPWLVPITKWTLRSIWLRFRHSRSLIANR